MAFFKRKLRELGEFIENKALMQRLVVANRKQQVVAVILHKLGVVQGSYHSYQILSPRKSYQTQPSSDSERGV